MTTKEMVHIAQKQPPFYFSMLKRESKICAYCTLFDLTFLHIVY